MRLSSETKNARDGGLDNFLQMDDWSPNKINLPSWAIADRGEGCMNETATKLIKKAVVRALEKTPKDVTFYQEQIDDPSLPPAYRMSLREGVDEWMQTLETGNRSLN